MSHTPARTELARITELSLLASDATRKELEALCAAARRLNVFSVCVPGSRVAQAAHWLEDSEVKVTCAVNWPLGAADPDVKRFETEAAVDQGAHFIEVAANIGRLKDGDDEFLLRELRDVVEAADERAVGVYFDTGVLTPEEIRRVCGLAVEAGAKGVATAFGFNPAGTVDAVKLMRDAAGAHFGLKVDGEMFEVQTLTALLGAGATRFGIKHGVTLLDGL